MLANWKGLANNAKIRSSLKFQLVQYLVYLPVVDCVVDACDTIVTLIVLAVFVADKIVSVVCKSAVTDETIVVCDATVTVADGTTVEVCFSVEDVSVVGTVEDNASVVSVVDDNAIVVCTVEDNAFVVSVVDDNAIVVCTVEDNASVVSVVDDNAIVVCTVEVNASVVSVVDDDASVDCTVEEDTLVVVVIGSAVSDANKDMKGIYSRLELLYLLKHL